MSYIASATVTKRTSISCFDCVQKLTLAHNLRDGVDVDESGDLVATSHQLLDDLRSIARKDFQVTCLVEPRQVNLFLVEVATTDALKRRLVHGRVEDEVEELRIVVAHLGDGDQRNGINRLADLDVDIRSLLDLQ
jgi:hypothetical protein